MQRPQRNTIALGLALCGALLLACGGPGAATAPASETASTGETATVAEVGMPTHLPASDDDLPPGIAQGLVALSPSAKVSSAIFHKAGDVARYEIDYYDERGNFRVVLDEDGEPTRKPEAVVGCSDALLGNLAGQWSMLKGESLEPARCIALRQDAIAAWFFFDKLDTDSGDESSELRRVVVAADGFEIRAEAREELAPWQRADEFNGALGAADFDGDGNDEIIELAFVAHHGEAHGLLTVLRWSGGTLEPLFTAPLLYDDAAAQEGDAATACTATWRLIEHDGNAALELDARIERGATADPATSASCLDGTHRYAYRDGALAEIE